MKISGLQNLAVGRRTAQISSIAAAGSSDSMRWSSDYAVDGNKMNSYKSGIGTCSHTKDAPRGGEKQPWWAVELDNPHFISSVVITNRADCCGKIKHNYQAIDGIILWIRVKGASAYTLTRAFFYCRCYLTTKLRN